MKKMFEAIGTLMGMLFAGGLMLLYFVAILGFTVLVFQIGFKTVKSVSNGVVSFFSSNKDDSVSDTKTIVLPQENMSDIAQSMCTFFNKEVEKSKDNPEMYRRWSSVNCEVASPYFVKMNYKLRVIVEPQEVLNMKTSLDRGMESDRQIKEICKIFYTDKRKSKNLSQVRIKFNIYGYDDVLLFSYDVDKNKCHPEQYATENKDESEL